jgi:hypothetical protein
LRPFTTHVDPLHGRENVNVAPGPSFAAAQTRPPCDSTIAVRHPRPIDYINCPPVPSSDGTGTMANPSAASNSTDLGLSFFSGHAAAVSAGSVTGLSLSGAF